MVWPFNGGKKRGLHEEVITDGLRSDGVPVDVITEDDVSRQTFRSKNGGRYYLAKDVDQFLDRVIESIAWYRGRAEHDMIQSAGSELVDDRPVIMNGPSSGDHQDDYQPEPDELPTPDIDDSYDRFKPIAADSGATSIPSADDEPVQTAPINPFTGLPVK